MTRSPPPLALLIEMPDARHVEMGAEGKAPLDHDLEELSDRLDRSHRVADPQPVHASGPDVDGGQRLTQQRRTKDEGRVEEGVALGHQALASSAAASRDPLGGLLAAFETAPITVNEWVSSPSQRCTTVTSASFSAAA